MYNLNFEIYSYDWFCGPGSQIMKLIHLKYIAINIFFYLVAKCLLKSSKK